MSIYACGSIRKFALASSLSVMFFAGNAFSQDPNVATIPFVVNEDATVTASREGILPISTTVSAGVQKNFTIYMGPEEQKTSVRNAAAGSLQSSPLLTSDSRGNINLRLPEQSYRTAEVTLHGVNGRRVLSQKVAAGTSANSLTRSSAAPGVYILNVKGRDGNTFTSRVTHKGGALRMNVAFGTSASTLRKDAAAFVDADDVWTFKVSADGYKDSTYSFKIVRGVNPTQVITLVKDGVVDGDTFDDPRDGQTYRIVTMPDGKVWMAENLNYRASDTDWPKNDVTGSVSVTDKGSWCYNNQPDSCAKYGRLYTWAAAVDACPSGWRLPDTLDWGALERAVGGSLTAGTKLKSSEYWVSYAGVPAGEGKDGFSALPGGYRYYDGAFYGVGYRGYWWTATETDASYAWGRGMDYGDEYVNRGTNDKDYGFSVRCVAGD